jgi:hypothetical protein
MLNQHYFTLFNYIAHTSGTTCATNKIEYCYWKKGSFFNFSFYAKRNCQPRLLHHFRRAASVANSDYRH